MAGLSRTATDMATAGAVTADIPLREDRVEEVEDYIDRTSSRRVSGFLPILGGSASSPVLRLIAIQEDERTSRQCCNSFLEDLTSECGKVSTIPGLGTRGLRAVEKKLGRRHEPVAAFAANTAAASAAPAAAVTAKSSSLALDDVVELYSMQEYQDEHDGFAGGVQGFQQLLLTARKVEASAGFTFASAGFVFSQYGNDNVKIGGGSGGFGNPFLFLVGQRSRDDFAVGPVGVFHFAAFGVNNFCLIAQIVFDAVVNSDVIQSLRAVTADHIVRFLG